LYQKTWNRDPGDKAMDRPDRGLTVIRIKGEENNLLVRFS
jgi:hypothetical protein